MDKHRWLFRRVRGIKRGNIKQSVYNNKEPMANVNRSSTLEQEHSLHKHNSQVTSTSAQCTLAQQRQGNNGADRGRGEVNATLLHATPLALGNINNGNSGGEIAKLRFFLFFSHVIIVT